MDELNGIVQKMIDAGESEENIKTVIEGYKPQEGPMTMDELERRAGKPQDSVSADPAAESKDMGSISEEPLSYYTALDLPPKGFPTTQYDAFAPVRSRSNPHHQ